MSSIFSHPVIQGLKDRLWTGHQLIIGLTYTLKLPSTSQPHQRHRTSGNNPRRHGENMQPHTERPLALGDGAALTTATSCLQIQETAQSVFFLHLFLYVALFSVVLCFTFTTDILQNMQQR